LLGNARAFLLTPDFCLLTSFKFLTVNARDNSQQQYSKRVLVYEFAARYCAARQF
jgi:hypothetical protein